MTTANTSSTTLDVLQANVSLLAEKERLEQQIARLVAVDQLRTEFIARLSHDLRTPLSSILGFSELVLADSRSLARDRERQVKECVEAIHRNGQQMLAMISELLDLTTIESGTLRLHVEDIPLTTLAEDLRAATAPVLDRAVITVSWPDPGRMAGRSLRGDRRRVVQALTNLVDNARKFTPPGGQVRIDLGTEGSEVVMTVSDSGPGIPPEARETLFKPYAKHSPRPQGHGLGLAIVKAIVDRHHGRLIVGESAGRQGLGGCQITIRLPGQGGLL